MAASAAVRTGWRAPAASTPVPREIRFVTADSAQQRTGQLDVVALGQEAAVHTEPFGQHCFFEDGTGPVLPAGGKKDAQIVYDGHREVGVSGQDLCRHTIKLH